MTAPMGAALRALAVKRGARLRAGGAHSIEKALDRAVLPPCPRAEPTIGEPTAYERALDRITLIPPPGRAQP